MNIKRNDAVQWIFLGSIDVIWCTIYIYSLKLLTNHLFKLIYCFILLFVDFLIIQFVFITARKRHQHVVPLIRIDNDITNIINTEDKNTGNIFEMFIKYYSELHCMRATEMNLKIKFHEDTTGENKFYGNTDQLAKLLLTKEDQIWEVKWSMLESNW